MPKNVTLSLKQFVSIAGIMTFAVFISLYFYSQIKLYKINNNIELRTHNNAKAELNSIINKLNISSSEATKKLSAWQEVGQQLGNKPVYPYWKSLRLFQSDRLPKHAIDVEIFDSNGVAIQKTTKSSIFYNFSPATTNKIVVKKNGYYYLLVNEPIYQNFNNTKTLIGYLLVQFDLLPYLRSIETLKYITPESIVFNSNTDVTPFANIKNMVQFTTINNRDLFHFKALFSNSLINLSLASAFFIFALFICIIKLIGQPLTYLNSYIADLEDSKEHDVQKRTKPLFRFTEIDKIHDSISQYHTALISFQSKLYNKNIELWQMAHVDPLTSAHNRRAFDDKLENVQKTLSRSSINISLLLIDVNDFKAINDTYGHQTGDDVLRSIVDTFQDVLRTGEDIYRIGGDEFAIILIDCDATSAEVLAQRCLFKYGQFDFSSLQLADKVRLSIGIASTIKANDDNQIKDLLWKADLAMYSAKKPSSGHVIIYDAKLNKENKVFVSWINQAIYTAIETGENISMQYQPIVDIKTNSLSYYEALIRIKHKDKVIHPDSIFPFIGSKSLEVDLDKAVILKVAADLENNLIPKGIGVSVNLSAQIITQEDLITWLEPLEKHLPDRDIILEVTETSLVSNLKQAISNLEPLQKRGFKIALDDFGSGYSSFSYLSNMPINIVKFDISLIISFTQNPNEHHIVSKLAQMISESGFEIVAEGIETEQQLAIIKNHCFDKVQGFLLDKQFKNLS